MRRLILLITVAAVMAAVAMALSASSAFAQGNPSCFGAIARSDTTTGGPGNVVGEVASALGNSGTAGKVASTFVPVAQQDRPCPLTAADLRNLIP